jgi:hypothetical protein
MVTAFVAIEIALRILNMGYGSSPEESDPFLHHVHPHNYRFVQRSPTGEYGGFEVSYNAEGRIDGGQRDAPVKPAAAPSCRVAIMGDSFAEGLEVPYAQSYAGLLESVARDRCETRDYGTRSYSPAIYLVQWTRVVSTWKPTDVFLMIYSNDISDDRTYLASAVMGPDGFPIAIRGPEGGWLTAQLRRLYAARVTRSLWLQLMWAWEHRGEDKMKIGGIVEENPPWASPTADFVLELNRRVRDAGSHLVVTVVPSRYKLMGDGAVNVGGGDLHERVKAWTVANQLEFVDLEQPFERATRAGIPLFYRRDIHFNAEGNALTAAVIARAYPNVFGRWPEITSAAVRAAYPPATASE